MIETSTLAQLERSELLQSSSLRRRVSEDRPYVALNMVSSVDGRVTVAGSVKALTGWADQALLQHLRTQADAVLVGAGTVRAEGYGGLLPEPMQKERRRQGRPPEPLLCVLSGRLQLSPDLDLFKTASLRILLITSTSAENASPLPHGQVQYLRQHSGDHLVRLPEVLHLLHTQWQIELLVCEGGPTLAAQLLEAGCCDELFVSFAPRLVGGQGKCGLASDHLQREIELRPKSLAQVDGYLFARYLFDSPA
ncbi:MAG: hypothetical protein DLM61_16415 [Pseudonocardiales bacterium]|nr:MAG: hypothetical protein DLM61_16415 [Pseudonocardiales bacterium]